MAAIAIPLGKKSLVTVTVVDGLGNPVDPQPGGAATWTPNSGTVSVPSASNNTAWVKGTGIGVATVAVNFGDILGQFDVDVVAKGNPGGPGDPVAGQLSFSFGPVVPSGTEFTRIQG